VREKKSRRLKKTRKKEKSEQEKMKVRRENQRGATKLFIRRTLIPYWRFGKQDCNGENCVCKKRIIVNPIHSENEDKRKRVCVKRKRISE